MLTSVLQGHTHVPPNTHMHPYTYMPRPPSTHMHSYTNIYYTRVHFYLVNIACCAMAPSTVAHSCLEKASCYAVITVFFSSFGGGQEDQGAEERMGTLGTCRFAFSAFCLQFKPALFISRLCPFVPPPQDECFCVLRNGLDKLHPDESKMTTRTTELPFPSVLAL